jgi:hypothetical protein
MQENVMAIVPTVRCRNMRATLEATNDDAG